MAVASVTNTDLVLNVTKAIDPTVLDLTPYEPFLDALCSTRDYQKDAIRVTLRYLLGERYPNLRALMRENLDASPTLKDVYGGEAAAERKLLFPDQLSCSLDLATGTGKSYVMYGIAAIMLGIGAVDQVVVLCPSLTIEAGLTDKFKSLASSEALRAAMPSASVYQAPAIINGTESIVPGAVCVENYHATFASSRSSIRPTLVGKGARTLILNDEAHHLYSSNGDMRRWAEFVGANDIGFRYVVGVSGTCYVDDAYFPDVVFRYSLREAIDAGVVKTIDYVAEDSTGARDEKFQKVYDNHQSNQQFYRKVKPLTLLVTRDIAAAKRLASDLVSFLASIEELPQDQAAAKVLTVTSDPDHKRNVVQLASVDQADSAVEWIVSVSMLTEGWDVKNVFQVVPHEERAFSSKLLIAQVLGRGLRVPDSYRGERPVLTVFNHDAWSSRIRHLVDEVLEIENRLVSQVSDKEVDYNFEIENIDYSKSQESEEHNAPEEYDFSKGYVSLASQVSQLERETTYSRVVTGSQREKRTLIRYKMFSVDEVAEHIHSKFRAIDLEESTDYASKYSVVWLRELIRESLKRVGETDDLVSEDNRQRLQAAFGVVHRKSSHTVRYVSKPNELVKLSTAQRHRDSISVSGLRRGDATVFADEDSASLSDEETRRVLNDVLEDDSLPRSAVEEVSNKFHFKTPLNIAIANHRPERVFVKDLIKPENAAVTSGWIKSTDQDFYSIEFGWRKGEHFRRGHFNPDFFIATKGRILVVEIKGDDEIDEPSDENRAKFVAATAHFAVLNAMLGTEKYAFHFLTPRDYDAFFQFLREGRTGFASTLDAALASS
ncbi:DEAD/DEAH box helicase [Microbacterium sp. SORGH_AS_0344]|uniref:DEAD/DEAH box helicase n=1 Tax=Microbacterium sp. SORGH_AS_0344 TaxID=3041767 RepID=UPI0027D873E3|nr:DEAD/DEAH box helicase family protein [Microbacterium sp. SORGH_AS_0344]